MTAAKVKPTILRLTGCSGQASDDVSAYPGEHERRTKTTLTPRSRWPTALDKATTMMTSEKLGCRRPSRPIVTQSLWSSSGGFLRERTFEEILLWKEDWQKVLLWRRLLFKSTVQQGAARGRFVRQGNSGNVAWHPLQEHCHL